MTNDRDTQFQGFARLELERLKPDLTNLYVALSRGTAEEIESAESIVQTLLAQAAYDLVAYIFTFAPITEYEYGISNVPDLYAWPKPD